VYPTSRLGYEILAKSVLQTPLSLGEDRFEWMICFNGDDNIAYSIIKDISKIAKVKIKLIRQNAKDCPINIEPPYLGMWKVCPPRISNEHEIICDNDIIITKKMPKIDLFLESKSTMILQDPVRYYGELDHLHDKDEQWNSGFIGLPPNYDLAYYIKQVWFSVNSPEKIGYPEEQSLLIKAVRNPDSIIITKEEILEIHADRKTPEITGKEFGMHFVQSNRNDHLLANKFLNTT
jgi:hypothetical protein